MGFQPSEVTLFGVVSFNHSTGQHELIGVQTNEVVVISDGSPSSEWSVLSVSGAALPIELFEAAWADGASNKIGSVALNMQSINADAFVNNATVTLTIEAGGNQDLTVHLRALPGLDMLKVSGGTALAGADSSSGPLRASGDPASTAGPGVLVAWNQIHWSTPSAGVTIAAGPATQTTMDSASPTSVDLALSTADPAPSPDPVGALFDGNATLTLTGPGGKTVNTGMTQVQIVEDTMGPVIAITGLDSEVGVSPGAAKDLDFQVEVSDDVYFAQEDVTITFSWTTRNGAPAVPDTVYGRVGANWQITSGSVPAGAAVTMPQPVNTTRPPIDHTGWNGVYASAEFASAQSLWGDGTPAGNIQVQLADGRFERFEVRVDASDLAGNASSETREVLISIPTDIVVCLDYSGSMSSLPTGGGPAPAAAESKWDAARAAANRFHAVYHAIAPAIGGVDLLDNKVGYVRFWWDDGTTSDATSAVVPLTSVGTTTAGMLVNDPDPAWAQYTPIADGVKASVAQLQDPSNTGWRRRVVIAMTDGYENRGTDIIDIRTTSSGAADFIPNVLEDPENGIIVHSCAFGQDAGLDATKMDDLATDSDPSDGNKGFGGQFHSTATAATPDAAKALTNTFLDILVDSVPSVEKLIPADAVSGSLTIDAGVARAVILTTSDAAATLNGPSAGIAVESSAAGVRWWTIQNPDPGVYSLTYGVPPAVGEVDLHGVVDLRLRSQFTVEGPGVIGSTLKLRACIREAGRPVSGADVRVRVVRPGQSEGELVTRYARVAKLRAFMARKPLKLGIALRNPDAVSRRASLVAAARKHFKLGATTHVPDGSIVLHEVAGEPGCYEATFTNTSVEGSYGFTFEARGSMQGGAAFERGYSVSRFLRPAPDPDLTGVTWVPGRLVEDKRIWTLVVKPTTSVGTAIGGGRAFGVALTAQKKTLALRDQLDGTYSTTLTLRRDEKPPAIELLQGGKRTKLRGATSAVPSHRVRITLEGIEIGSGSDHLDAEKALMFDSLVVPGGDRERAVLRRFPQPGGIARPEKGVCKGLSIVIFDGALADGDDLMIAVGPHGHDPVKGKLTAYRRRLFGPVRSWVGQYGPDDEKRDPEELRDWRLRYRVELL